MFKKLFNKKEKVNERRNTYVACVLMSQNTINFDKFQKDLRDDWNIEYDEALAYDSESKDYSRVFDVDGVIAAVSLMPAPIPNEEAVYHARANHSWTDGERIAKEHVSHILVSVIGGNQPNKVAAELHVKLCATALKQVYATALDSLGTLFRPQDYIDYARALMIDMNSFPIYNLVYFDLYQGSEENTVSLYTYGLESFNKKEIEIVNSKQEAKVAYDFLVDVANYVIGYDVELVDGETIGFTEDQKLPICISQAVSLDPSSETVKILY